MIVASDLGGTKCVMALFRADSLEVVREQTYKSSDYVALDDIVAEFQKGAPHERITGACFAVAGPVDGDMAKITNLPWTIDAKRLSQQLNGVHVALLNDLQATALGTLVLPDAQIAVLQPGQRPDHATIAVIAPGTGLGEATLVSDGKTYRALPSEGGHADWAPTTDDELELLRFLRAKHGPHVSNERLLSGNGLGDLYSFVCVQRSQAERTWPGDRNAAITEAGLAKSDAAAERALDMFVEILGAEAGNCALRAMATGGVMIGGGIPPKILPALQSGRFVERFADKGRFAAWMKGLSVRVSLEPRAALLGAAHQVASKGTRS